MVKRALLVGCNYPGTDAELRGCINDVWGMQEMLQKYYGFTAGDMTIMIDTDSRYTKPTGKNMKAKLQELVAASQPGDVLFFHFSGHGTQVPGFGEGDGKDEAICPTDLNVIVDDDLVAIFSKLQPGVNFTFVADCCHSGSMLDHPTVQIAGSKTGGGGADSLASLFGARALPGGGAAPASPAAGILESLIACCLAPKTQEDAAPAANGGATNGTAATQRGVDGNVVKNRSLPTSQLFSMLSNQTGQNVNATNFHASMTSMFGADASMKAVAVVMALMDPNFRSTLASNPMAAITSLMGGPKPAPQPGVPTSPSFNFSGLASSLLGSGTAGGKPGAAAQNGSLATLLGFGSGASSGAAMPSMPAMPTGGGGGGGLGSMLTGIMGALQQPGAGGGGMAMPQMPAPVAPTAPSQPQSAAALIFGGAQAPPATAPSGGNLFSSVFGGGNHFGMKTNPDTGVLISGCQSHETSADCMPGGDPRQAHGALSNAIQTIIRQNRQQGGAGMSFYDLVTAVRAKLATERFEQNPCLECCNTNVQKPFVC